MIGSEGFTRRSRLGEDFVLSRGEAHDYFYRVCREESREES